MSLPAFRLAPQGPSTTGPAHLRQLIVDGLGRTGTDPWLATDIADALGRTPLSVRQACEVLARQGLVEIVARKPFAVRRAT